jgi:hypothetical protein
VRRLLLLVVVGLVLVGCGGSATSDTAAVDAEDTDDAASAPAGAEASTPAAAADASDGAQESGSAEARAPFGTVATVDGEQLDGAMYAGDSLALWFWAPW